MNNQKLTSETLMRILPSVLDRDEGMNMLAKTVAVDIDSVILDLQNAGIYFRVGELPEALLDVLAEDLGIHWYNYNHKLETKRRVVESAFDVHKHFGTKGAMVASLCAIWPNSSVEEWFEYSGDPYYFRVLVEANDDNGEPIKFTEIEKTVKLYKNARSRLQDNKVILRVTCNVVIQTSQNRQFYHSVPCGTLPRVSTHGDVSDSGLIVGAGLGTSIYSSTPCGTPLGALM